MNLGEEAPWAGVELYVPLAFPAGNYTLTLGAWYINPTDPRWGGNNPAGGAGATALNNDELDLYAVFNFPLWIFDASPTEVKAWQRAGFSVVTLQATEVTTALQSGMIDAYMTSALSAASSNVAPVAPAATVDAGGAGAESGSAEEQAAG